MLTLPSLKGNTHGIFLSVMHPKAVVVAVVARDDVISAHEVVDCTVVVVVSMLVEGVVVIHVSRLQYPHLLYCPFSFNDVAHQYLPLKLAHLKCSVAPRKDSQTNTYCNLHTIFEGKHTGEVFVC